MRASTAEMIKRERVEIKTEHDDVAIVDEHKRERVVKRDRAVKREKAPVHKERPTVKTEPDGDLYGVSDDDLYHASDDDGDRPRLVELEDRSKSRATFKGRLRQYAYASTSSTPSTPSVSPSKRRVDTIPSSSRVTRTATVSVTTPRKRVKKVTTAKTTRAPAKYAPPSTYAHLPGLPDCLGPSMFILFVGVNPGQRSAAVGHAYAHPSNLFWKLLHQSGITPRRCRPDEDQDLPRLYGLGNTNIVSRPSREAAELSRAEMDASYAVLEAKVARWRPESVCVVGKSIWESVWRVRHGRNQRKHEFRYGWQDPAEDMAGARVFVATSTSGAAASTLPAEKLAIWRPLGEWVRQRRAERGCDGVPTDMAVPGTVNVAADVEMKDADVKDELPLIVKDE
ncbi:MAG: hypothetical protein M1832_003045 [Thelocarpon impressellum]|nr:MAG: hypothetical protein M1832_003045 [Thelocarpon impressellum]